MEFTEEELVEFGWHDTATHDALLEEGGTFVGQGERPCLHTQTFKSDSSTPRAHHGHARGGDCL